jgi:probable HAF family extracellular repeat protein
MKRSHLVGSISLGFVTAVIQAAAALWILTTAPSAHAAASILALGYAPGDNYSFASSVSGDGSVVVGGSGLQPYVGTGSYQAFRWSVGSGMAGLGHLPGDYYSTAPIVSADGSVVVGISQHDYGSGGQAFRWTAASGMVGLGYLSGGTNSSPVGISSNGSLIIGTSYSASGGQAFRWSVGSGMVGLGYLPGSTSSSAAGVSADGSVIIGTSYSASGSQAFRWTAGSGMVGLGYLPGGTSNSATAVSADGSVIVGTSSSASGNQAFRWTAGSGLVALGVLPGDTSIRLTGISADGSVIVGTSSSATGNRAFRWTPGLGMVALVNNNYNGANGTSSAGSVVIGSGSTGVFRWTTGSGVEWLSDVLVANGANPAALDVSLDTVSGISADGSTIVGWGEQLGPGRPEAWVATIPGLIGVSPWLSIKSSSSTKKVVLSWSTNYTGCTLQASTRLDFTNCTNCASPTVSGACFVVTNPMSAGAQFFRLKR